MKFKLALAIALVLAGQVLRLDSGQALAQDSSNVRTIGFYDTPGKALGIAVSGNYAYVADYYTGLRIIDISDPANPLEAGFYDTPGSAKSVAVAGNYAFVADTVYYYLHGFPYGAGLRIINIDNPSSPSLTGSYNTTVSLFDVAVSDSYAYVVAGGVGLGIFNISDPANPTMAGSYNTSGSYAAGVAVSGSYAYVAYYNDGLRIIDISNPASPTLVGFCDTPGLAYYVEVSGSYAYVADLYSLRIIDISNPASPTEAGFYNTPGYAYGVAVSGGYAYVADNIAGLRIIDIRNPASPTEVGYYNTPGVAVGVAVSGSLAYVADENGGLRIYQGYGPAGVSDVPGSECKVGSLKLQISGSRITYQVPKNGRATIKVYNLLGQEVCCLLNGNVAAGQHRLTWNNSRVSSGVYLVRLESNGQTATGKMLVVR